MVRRAGGVWAFFGCSWSCGRADYAQARAGRAWRSLDERERARPGLAGDEALALAITSSYSASLAPSCTARTASRSSTVTGSSLAFVALLASVNSLVRPLISLALSLAAHGVADALSCLQSVSSISAPAGTR